ncbi:uncharacterized protein [Blastocystis hominis]|uniref:J domain-containing protein n=1 Tax=Blastocystis hominis TaxID=12968 RepID=D8LZB6_BLAHO|nr:uncharacterized protein [Blastocystis hominis]CBK21155.2 unnamed protein product [Blastocystis hominis]|eukprot:XP_012895203.1 uncharacterized protein [Blastocystis hominis]
MTANMPDVVESDSDTELIKLEDVHFPGGIRPFQEPPRTSDNTDLDYYAILGLDCKASDTDIKSAVRAMSMFYHPDRRRRVFRNVETPEGLDEECDKILEYVRMAKNTLENEGEHRNYNFLHFQVGEFDEREILKHDKAEAEELVKNMRMTAQFIEEEELRKENEGLIIEEAWFGAIMDSVDPNLTIEDMQLGRIIDVRIPMTIQIIDSKITRGLASPPHSLPDNKEQGYSLTKVPGFYDCCVGEEKRLFVRYRFHRLTFIMNIGEHDRILIPSRCIIASLSSSSQTTSRTCPARSFRSGRRRSRRRRRSGRR